MTYMYINTDSCTHNLVHRHKQDLCVCMCSHACTCGKVLLKQSYRIKMVEEERHSDEKEGIRQRSAER